MLNFFVDAEVLFVSECLLAFVDLHVPKDPGPVTAPLDPFGKGASDYTLGRFTFSLHRPNIFFDPQIPSEWSTFHFCIHAVYRK